MSKGQKLGTEAKRLRAVVQEQRKRERELQDTVGALQRINADRRAELNASDVLLGHAMDELQRRRFL